MRKKTGRQLDREIAAALSRRSRGHATKKADVTFTDLIRDDDPSSLQVAEDFLLERDWKLRDVTGGMSARHFTIDMKPLYGPANQWKMVQVSVDRGGLGFPHETHVDYKVANGAERVERKEMFAGKPNEGSRKAAIATAWAIAKAIKPLPLDASKKQVEEIVDEIFYDGLDNLNKAPEELF